MKEYLEFIKSDFFVLWLGILYTFISGTIIRKVCDGFKLSINDKIDLILTLGFLILVFLISLGLK